MTIGKGPDMPVYVGPEVKMRGAPKFVQIQAVAGANAATGNTLVMLFGLDTAGRIWVKTNALDRSIEWRTIDPESSD